MKQLACLLIAFVLAACSVQRTRVQGVDAEPARTLRMLAFLRWAHEWHIGSAKVVFVDESAAFIDELRKESGAEVLDRRLLQWKARRGDVPIDKAGREGMIVHVTIGEISGGHASGAVEIWQSQLSWISIFITYEFKDGSWKITEWESHALAMKKPNQSLEPTTLLGTSAAEQPLVPSRVVAHL